MMPKPKDAPPFVGFQTPYFTQIPNPVFDDLLADLSGAEFKVLAYLMRRTYGWQKDSDNIGLKQLTDGIKGTDRGTGLSKSTVAVALKSLEEWGLIERQQNHDDQRGDLPTTYRVRLSNTGRGENRTPLASAIGHGGVLESDTQKINPQNTNQKNDRPVEDDEQFARHHSNSRSVPKALAAQLVARHTRDGKLDRDRFMAALPKG